MKILRYISVMVLLTCHTSCMKEYSCVCTRSKTGEKEYGDKFKTGPVRKPAFEETCKNTENLSAGTLEDCHLE